MAELTPRLKLPYPANLAAGYYPTIKSFFLQNDAVQWALAENDNLTYQGGGLFSWSSTTALLSWTDTIAATSFTSNTQARALIAGPPAPGGSISLNDGEVVFFTMPRLMTTDVTVNLVKSTLINQSSGTKMNDLRLFCARIGDTIYFPYGKSLKDGESIVLWGGGSSSSISPHIHQGALVIEPGAIGVSTLDLQTTYLSDTRLTFATMTGYFSVGETITGGTSGTTAVVTSKGIGYVTVGTTTGIGYQTGETGTGNYSLVDISLSATAGVFSVGDTCAAGAATGVIVNVVGSTTGVTVKVNSGTFPSSGSFTDTTSLASGTITATTSPYNTSGYIAIITAPTTLRKVDLYRNGALQAEGVGYDYTVNYSTGIVTLASATLSTSERFVALRETIPTSTASPDHSHSRLYIPIAAPTSVISVISTILDPSPNQLINVDLYRNGMLQAVPGDYSIDMSTGLVTLVTAAAIGELFIANRQLA